MKHAFKAAKWARVCCLALTSFSVVSYAQGIIHTTPPDPVDYSPLPVSHDFDFNYDGAADFTLVSDGTSVNIVPHGNNAVLSQLAPPPDIDSFAVPLAQGEVISGSLEPQLVWYRAMTGPAGHSTLITSQDIGSEGLWQNVNGFAGVQLNFGGQTYYGWVHIENYEINAGRVFDWAYESTPNTPIVAGAVPEPGTFALFSLGTAAFLVRKYYRKK